MTTSPPSTQRTRAGRKRSDRHRRRILDGRGRVVEELLVPVRREPEAGHPAIRQALGRAQFKAHIALVISLARHTLSTVRQRSGRQPGRSAGRGTARTAAPLRPGPSGTGPRSRRTVPRRCRRTRCSPRQRTRRAVPVGVARPRSRAHRDVDRVAGLRVRDEAAEFDIVHGRLLL